MSQSLWESANMLQLKVVIIGETGTGKTCMCVRYYNNQFNDTCGSPCTIGASYFRVKLMVGEESVKLNIWDTSGQEKFCSVVPYYYRNADGAIIVYDITNKNSFKKVPFWMKQLESNTPTMPVLVLCGNKLDLHKQRQVEKEEALSLASQYNMVLHETSAKCNTGITEAFTTLTERIVKSHQMSPRVPSSAPSVLLKGSRNIVKSFCTCSKY